MTARRDADALCYGTSTSTYIFFEARINCQRCYGMVPYLIIFQHRPLYQIILFHTASYCRHKCNVTHTQYWAALRDAFDNSRCSERIFVVLAGTIFRLSLWDPSRFTNNCHIFAADMLWITYRSGSTITDSSAEQPGFPIGPDNGLKSERNDNGNNERGTVDHDHHHHVTVRNIQHLSIKSIYLLGQFK